LKKFVERLLARGWHRNVSIVAVAYLLAIGGASVAVASSSSGSHHRPIRSTSSQHRTGKERATKPTSARVTPSPSPTPTATPAPSASPATPVTTPVTAPPPPANRVAPPVTNSGWPDGSNTGVPVGTRLTASPGLTITTAGTVINALDIDGDVVVRASNVTIRNSRISGRVDNGDQNAYKNTVIQRSEVIGPYDAKADQGIAGVGFTGYTCDGCNVRGWGKGFGMSADVTIKNSWVHDIVVFGDPANGGSHNEAILSLGGTNLTILNNRLDAGDAPNASASLALYSQWEAYKNVLVQGNLFDGGGYCLYAGLGGSYGASNTKFINNTFGTKYSPRCGWYGPAVAYDPGNGNQWTGNVMQSGAAVDTPGRG